MLTKSITAFGRSLTLVCDGRCDKAWGINHRPHVQLGDGKDPDDYCWIPDQELGEAPRDPGTYEGGHGKPSGEPLTDPGRMNKWCFRQCERSDSFEPGEPLVVPDLSNPRPNNFGFRKH